MQVNIKGLDKGAVLKALHDGTQPLGMGRLHAINHLPLEQAQKEYAEALKQPVVVIAPGGTPVVYFDYYHGRPLKVDLGGDEFEPSMYDRDAGEGAAKRAIDKLRAAG
jgi:hypothetical protein